MIELALGRVANSRSFWYGIGCSVRRRADRRVEVPEPVLGDLAAISAPSPQNSAASWTTTARLVFATEAMIVSESSGTSSRVDHLDVDPLALELGRRPQCRGTIAPSATTVTSAPAARRSPCRAHE